MIEPSYAGATTAPFGTYACYACREEVGGSPPSRAKWLRALFIGVFVLVAAGLLSTPAHAAAHLSGHVQPSADWLQ